MAEYIRFRLTAAKVGVTMALAALIAGIAEKARTGTPSVRATPVASFLKLKGLTGEIAFNFNKLEDKWIKLNSELTSFEHKVGRTYLAVKKADRTFLKIRDANIKFLKADGTAANSQLLGNLAPSAFVQGNHASVVSGALLNVPATSQPLLSLKGGIIVVNVAHPPGAAGPTITIHNGAQQDLVGVAEVNGKSQALNLKAGTDALLPAVQNGLAEVRVQIFPGGSFSEVVSILIGLTPNPANNQQIEAVAQAFTGGV
jgi:hypothetical protein